MNTIVKTNGKKAKRIARNEQIERRRIMHKFQLTWWNKNIKYTARKNKGTNAEN